MRWFIAAIIGLSLLLRFVTAYAEDPTGAEGWEQLAQEEVVRIHSHFDWVGSQVADLDEEIQWPKSSPPLHLEVIDPNDFDVPIEMNRAVKDWMMYYLGPGRRTFEVYLARSARFESMIRREFKARGLPQDLIYIAMIESGFVADAYSKSGACGIWQIMPSTARLYDVRLDWWVDDRRDPIRSTQAAASLLLDLKKSWGDWYLALAAYNGGGRVVKRGMNQTGSSDFWTIARSGVFAGETRNYVPKFIAAMILGKYREVYGFSDIKYLPAEHLDVVELGGGASVEQLSRCAGMTERELRTTNPGLLQNTTPPEGYPLRLTLGAREAFVSCIAEAALFQSISFKKHVVAKGEVMSTICEQYGVAQDVVLRTNDRDNPNQLRAGETLLIPIMDGAVDTEPIQSHVVQRGDTLSGLASQYSVSVQQIKDWNSLSGVTIHLGQTLKIGVPGASRGLETSYSVQPADTLSSIAIRYGVTVSELQRWNQLHFGTLIRVGQNLKVYMKDAKWKEYVVKDGDSLGKIAAKHSCTVKDLTIWNGLSTSFLSIGQRLRIRD